MDPVRDPFKPRSGGYFIAELYRQQGLYRKSVELPILEVGKASYRIEWTLPGGPARLELGGTGRRSGCGWSPGGAFQLLPHEAHYLVVAGNAYHQEGSSKEMLVSSARVELAKEYRCRRNLGFSRGDS